MASLGITNRLLRQFNDAMRRRFLSNKLQKDNLYILTFEKLPSKNQYKKTNTKKPIQKN